MKLNTFFNNFELLADVPNGMQKLRELILQLAISGGLRSSLVDESQAIEFITADGVRVLRYSNLHVVEGAARGYAKIIGQKTKHDIEGITAVDPERDLVLLKHLLVC